MIIHFSILAVILGVSFLWEKGTKLNKIKFKNYIMPLMPWIIIFGYIAFLVAMRTDMNDTSVYIDSFKAAPGNFDEIFNIILGNGKDKGFNILANLFKMFISDNYHLWFAFFSVIESVCFIYILRRESVSILGSCFFFFASTMYYNYFSMMRQWFAVALFFLAFKWLKQKKFIPYLLVCLFAAQIHNSAYMCIPVYFIVTNNPYSKKQLMIIFALCVLLMLTNPILSSLENSDSTYNYVFSTMTQNTGSSPIRIIIAFIPVLLSFMYVKKIKEENDNTIYICINISIINFLLNVLATYTSGLYIIRFSNYFSIFNMILLPFILEKVLVGKNKRIIKICFYVFYFVFFCYQMNHQGSFGYSSDILGTFM